jgi:hypothetical protein
MKGYSEFKFSIINFAAAIFLIDRLIFTPQKSLKIHIPGCFSAKRKG